MATRVELDAAFDTYPGTDTIRSPGKFEGECLYVPYFWGIMLDGGADDEDEDEGVPIAIFDVNADDVAQFPELADRETVALWEDDQGFVHEC